MRFNPSFFWAQIRYYLFSLRTLLALLFTLFMVFFTPYVYKNSPPELFNLLAYWVRERPELLFSWFWFDNALTKMCTILVAPIFVFDSISGERGSGTLEIYLSKPIERKSYILTKIISASIIFGIIYFFSMAVAYFYFGYQDIALSAERFVITAFLLWLLSVFTMSVGVLISLLTKKSVTSFLAIFGLMAILIVPSASKYTSDFLEEISKLTPHYYATYFAVETIEPLTVAAYILIILIFAAIPAVLAILKFRREDI